MSFEQVNLETMVVKLTLNLEKKVAKLVYKLQSNLFAIQDKTVHDAQNLLTMEHNANGHNMKL